VVELIALAESTRSWRSEGRGYGAYEVLGDEARAWQVIPMCKKIKAL
jgi:hypothetical protein